MSGADDGDRLLFFYRRKLRMVLASTGGKYCATAFIDRQLDDRFVEGERGNGGIVQLFRFFILADDHDLV